jgi:hypothetical protein
MTGGTKSIEPSLRDFFGYEHARHPSIVACAAPSRQLHRLVCI